MRWKSPEESEYSNTYLIQAQRNSSLYAVSLDFRQVPCYVVPVPDLGALAPDVWMLTGQVLGSKDSNVCLMYAQGNSSLHSIAYDTSLPIYKQRISRLFNLTHSVLSVL